MTHAFILSHIESEGTVIARPGLWTVNELLHAVNDRAALNAKYNRMIAIG